MATRSNKKTDRSTLWIVIGSAVVMVVVVIAAAMANRGGAVANPDLLTNAEVHARGPENAAVTLTEFADYDCSHCRDFSAVTTALLAAFPNDLRFIHRHYPLSGETGASFQEMLAAEAAGAQGKFWEYNDLMWANYGMNTREQLITYAGQIEGLDVGQFTRDLDNQTYRERVIQDLRDGRDLGITGTPTVYLNDQLYTDIRDLPTLTAAIQALIDAKSQGGE